MHVLFLPSWYPSDANDNAGCFFREQAMALQDNGIQVGVISAQCDLLQWIRSRRRSHWRAYSVIEHGVYTTRVPLLLPPLVRLPFIDAMGPLSDLRLAAQRRILNKALRASFLDYTKNNGWPDLVHVHSLLPSGQFAIWLQKKYGLPFVITEHSSAYARNLLTSAQLREGASIAEKASFRIAVSTRLAKLLDRELYCRAGKWVSIPNLVTSQFFKKSLRKRQAKPFVFLSVAFLQRNKRVDLLLRAFRKAFENESSVKLRVGGDGPEKQRLENLAGSLKIENRVEFLGSLPRERVISEMDGANAFALASDYETFGIVLAEANAMGLPVVATNCGGPEDIVNEINGLLVDTGDVDQFALAMRKIVEEYNKYTPALIRAKCEEKYSARQVSLQLQRVYELALS